MELASKYNPADVEGKWYQYWLDNHLFSSKPDSREPYTIVIPPPNVTGVLHMGHMLNNTIQDILVRRARMEGKNACWVPGTDHASIATEAKVVNKLAAQGIKKTDLTRDEFLKHAWEWTDEHGGIILKQLRKLGASCDWDRTAFTMDEKRSESVIKVFVDLYNKGLIYRGVRMVNWDPKALTALSDEEVIYKEEHSKLITGILTGSILLLLMFIVITIVLRRQRQKITLSTQRLERLRTDAENATSAKSIFLSNMSHEIRTPLNALSGFSSLLTEEGLDDDTRRQCNEVILQNSELLLKLINDVIDLSSLEFGKIQFSIGRYDVVSICRNVADTVSKIKQTQAEICFTTELESMEIETDDSRLQQVLINLLINATKFTPQGSITLELKKQSEQELLFSVTDTGCGIPKDKQAAIFQRFEKLNENAQGSGLGLSICQLIIEHIGGRIWIDPDYTGGSRFFFTHPLQQPQPAKGRKESEV